MRLLLLLLVLSFVACTPQQRLSRILRNHPDLMRHDTVTYRDTIVTPGFVVDSSFLFYNGDTVYITKENVKVRLIYVHDTLKTNITQRPDTIYKEIKVIVNKVIEVKIPWYKDRVNLFLIGAGLVLLLILLWVLKKR
jgi:hypothetical protein